MVTSCASNTNFEQIWISWGFTCMYLQWKTCMLVMICSIVSKCYFILLHVLTHMYIYERKKLLKLEFRIKCLKGLLCESEKRERWLSLDFPLSKIGLFPLYLFSIAIFAKLFGKNKVWIWVSWLFFLWFDDVKVKSKYSRFFDSYSKYARRKSVKDYLSQLWFNDMIIKHILRLDYF